jgi:hypothetical protein
MASEMRTANDPGTISRAQEVVDALKDAESRDDLWDLEKHATGWLDALLTEGLIDRPEYDRLTKSMNLISVTMRHAADGIELGAAGRGEGQ